MPRVDDKDRQAIILFSAATVGMVGALGVVAVFSGAFIPRAPELAASQTSKDEVTLTTSKPVLYKDKSLQDAIEEVRIKCGGRLTIEVPEEAVVNILSFRTNNPNCVAALSKNIKIGSFRSVP